MLLEMIWEKQTTKQRVQNMVSFLKYQERNKFDICQGFFVV